MRPYGKLTQKLVDELTTGPKTLGQLAAAIYGDNNEVNRGAAHQLILALRRRKQHRVERDNIYILKGR